MEQSFQARDFAGNARTLSRPSLSQLRARTMPEVPQLKREAIAQAGTVMDPVLRPGFKVRSADGNAPPPPSRTTARPRLPLINTRLSMASEMPDDPAQTMRMPRKGEYRLSLAPELKGTMDETLQVRQFRAMQAARLLVRRASGLQDSDALIWEQAEVTDTLDKAAQVGAPQQSRAEAKAVQEGPETVSHYRLGSPIELGLETRIGNWLAKTRQPDSIPARVEPALSTPAAAQPSMSLDPAPGLVIDLTDVPDSPVSPALRTPETQSTDILPGGFARIILSPISGHGEARTFPLSLPSMADLGLAPLPGLLRATVHGEYATVHMERTSAKRRDPRIVGGEYASEVKELPFTRLKELVHPHSCRGRLVDRDMTGRFSLDFWVPCRWSELGSRSKICRSFRTSVRGGKRPGGGKRSGIYPYAHTSIIALKRR